MEKTTYNQTNTQNELADTIIGQILQIRDTGKTNMFNISAVQRTAYDMGLFELVVFLDDRRNSRKYCEFILHGKNLRHRVCKGPKMDQSSLGDIKL